MVSWLAATPSILVAAGVLLFPGVLITSAAGARGLHRWSLAVPVTFTLASLSAIALQMLSIPFTALSFGIVTASVFAVVYAGRLMLSRAGRLPQRYLGSVSAQPKEPRSSGRLKLAVTVALALSAVLIGTRLAAGIGSPTAIAQLFDNIFHLNAVSIIHSTGNGSSLTLGNLTDASKMFYPAAFHDVAAIVMSLGVGDVSVVLNGISLIMSAVVWPISLMYLATRLFGMRPSVLVLTGVLAAGFSAFPYRMLSFGVLYPFHSAVAMLPVIIALVIEFFGMTRQRPIPLWTAVVALAATVPGVALAHPSALIAALVFTTPFVVARVVREFTAQRSTDGRRFALTLSGIYLAAVVGAFLTVRPALDSAPWVPSQSYKEAIGGVLAFSPGPSAVAWGVFVIGILGYVAVARHPAILWPVAALFGIGGVLYFASAAVGNEVIRDLVTGVWYRDTERISALFAVASFPLVLAGALALYEAARAAAQRIGRRSSHATTIALAIVAVILVVLTQRGPISQAQEWLNESFGQRGVQALLTDDERDLMGDVRAYVPADGVVVGNPFTGASLTSAFADRRSLAPHVFGSRTRDEQFLLDHWDEAGSDPRVCEVIRKLDAYWALDFGNTGVLGGTQDRLPGTDALSGGDAQGITELARIGDIGLYEATVCGPPRK